MLPQFELQFFPSQIFWLFICFGTFFLFVQFYFFPKMFKIFAERNAKIEKDLKRHDYNMSLISELSETHENMLKLAKSSADGKLKAINLETRNFIETRLKEIDINFNAKFEEAKKNFEAELLEFDSSLDEQIIKSATQIIEKIENKTPDADLRGYLHKFQN